jgi:hypothetical protein
MTPSPVVGPDRDRGRLVEINVDHKSGAPIRIDAAVRKCRSCLDGRLNSISPLSMVSWSSQLILPNRASRFDVMPTPWLTLHRSPRYDAI